MEGSNARRRDPFGSAGACADAFVELYRWPLLCQLSQRSLHRRRCDATRPDFPGPIGTPILAAAPGRVSFVGQKSGYGNVVEVDHDEDLDPLRPFVGFQRQWATASPRDSRSPGWAAPAA